MRALGDNKATLITLAILLVTVLPGAPSTWAAGTETGPTPAGFSGFRNPAAVYCQEVLGYPYRIVRTPKGDIGQCVMPDGTQCDAWQFLTGRCGDAFNYCARIDLETSTRSDGLDPFSPEYAVCVDASRRVVLGSVSNLSKLSALSEGCSGGAGQSAAQASPESQQPVTRTPPSTFDWRDEEGGNWLSPVRNQGYCGSCWAFATVGVVESTLNIAGDDPDLDLDLAEEFLVSDCYMRPAWEPYASCCGGWVSLDFVRDAGLPDEACFPYAESCGCDADGACNADCAHSEHICTDRLCSERCSDWKTRMVTVDTVETISTSADPDLLKQTVVDTGPVATSIGVGTSVGGHFDGDIYRCDDDTMTNHGVVIVGWDDTGGYWIVRNSWGATWNGDGYFKVGYGECHIAFYAASATGSGIGSDANDDGTINAADLAATISYAGGFHEGIGHRDCNADTYIDSNDVPCIAGLIFGD